MLEEFRAYIVPDTRVAAGFPPMPIPYLRLLGLIEDGQVIFDERPVEDGTYQPPHLSTLSKSFDTPLMPEAAGEVMRLRHSTLEVEAIAEEDKRAISQAFLDVIAIIPEEVPFAELITRLRQGNVLAARPATYAEALYALELARLTTADNFQHRIACYELSLTAAFYCHSRELSIDWCLGLSHYTDAPHAWLEVDGRPVQGQADEVIAGAYQKLLQI